jgi:hypothetical protein
MESGREILTLECGVYRSGSLRTGAERNNAYRIVVGKLERERPFGSIRCRWGEGGPILKWNSRSRIGGCELD